MEIKENIKNWVKDAVNYITRHLTWVILILAGMYFLQPTRELIGKFLIIVILEGIALALSNVALFVYTKIDFTRTISYGENKLLDHVELNAFSRVIAAIFIGVHVLVGLSFFILQLEVL